MRTRMNLLLILAAVFVVIMPLFRPGFFVSHDGELHLGRIPAYARELSSLQFPVRWSSTLNYEFGTPIFSFMYPLPYLLTSVPYWLTNSAIFSLKLVLGLSILLSAFAMYSFVKAWKNDEFAAVFASVVYTWMPYRLLNIYTRVALGEAVAFIFPPVMMLGALWLYQGKLSRGVLLTWLGVAGLVLSHNAMSLMFVGPLFLWYFVAHVQSFKSPQEIRKIAILVGAWISGILTSAFFWLPALLEKKYTLIDSQLVSKDFSKYFISVAELLHTPWSSNSELTPAFFGVSGLLIAVIAIIGLYKFRSRATAFLLLMLALSLVMTMSVSRVLWENLPLLPYFQLPWRFLSLTVWATALLVPTSLSVMVKGKWFFAALVITLLALQGFGSLSILTPAQYVDAHFEKYPGTTTWHEEGTPIWTAGAADKYPESPFLTADGVTVQVIQSITVHKSFSTTSTESAQFVLQQVYFPGWKSSLNGVEQPIQFQDPSARGLMLVELPAGENIVEFQFTKTKVRATAEILSIMSLGWIASLWWVSRQWERRYDRAS
jgi:hypothetical protein